MFNGREAQASPVKAAQPSTAGAQQREKGTVATLKDNYGFLTCAQSLRSSDISLSGILQSSVMG